ncbi:MAG: hypothetical protein JKY43_03210 [Phycisphaerales bacterium]|nr:hypothetical protein [Phycisphaerales bacterium]
MDNEKTEMDIWRSMITDQEKEQLIIQRVSKRYELSYMFRTSRDVKKTIIEAVSEDEALGKLISEHPKCIWLTINIWFVPTLKNKL